MKRSLLAALAVLVILLVAAFSPIKPHLVAPAWDVTVVDASGAPVPGMKVEEQWHDYSCQLGQPCQRVAHETHLLSDADGHAHFPAIHTRRAFAQCTGGTSQQMDQMMSLAHGNFKVLAVFGGESISLLVEDRGYCIDWSGPTQAQASKVVVPDKWLYGLPSPAIR